MLVTARSPTKRDLNREARKLAKFILQKRLFSYGQEKGFFKSSVEERLKDACLRRGLAKIEVERAVAFYAGPDKSFETTSLELYLEKALRADANKHGPVEAERLKKHLRIELEKLLPRFLEQVILKIVEADTDTELLGPVAVIRQESVGHGGFHHGRLGVDSASLRWIYDCGSWRKKGKDVLERRIAELAKRVSREDGRPIDLLFVSHFDADHVNGLNSLLRNVKVDTAVIPYLGADDAFAIFAGSLVSGSWSPSLIESVVDPAGWFSRRGVKRVIRIRPGSPPEGGEESLAPTDPISPEEPKRIRTAWVPGKRTIVVDQKRKNVTCELIDATPGSAFHAVEFGRSIDWWFIPYCHPISNLARSRLRKVAKTVVGKSVNSREFKNRLVQMLASAAGRSKLKQLHFKEDLGDANAISLSLYVGPIGGKGKFLISYSDYGENLRPPGWLLTGDAKLRNNERRTEWLKFYSKRAPGSVGTMMLPHHGSPHNFDREILSIAPNARLFVTANYGDRSRPHEDVKADVEELRDGAAKIQIVSEHQSKGLIEISSGQELGDHLIRVVKAW